MEKQCEGMEIPDQESHLINHKGSEHMPDTKYGKCPWCERHNVALTFAMGQYDGHLWCDYICYRCLNVARDLPYPADKGGDKVCQKQRN